MRFEIEQEDKKDVAAVVGLKLRNDGGNYVSLVATNPATKDRQILMRFYDGKFHRCILSRAAYPRMGIQVDARGKMQEK
ncbi:hypothetical protein LCGC14_0476050 [marine sediment metagenome]|uniref:Uncharacterized protein n=1 Tax=marine sediment metagenome TaxID=412755 RepID=A0A0F9VJK1_9ZZZZ